MISPRFAPVVFGFILSALMSFIVSGILTFRTAGLAENFLVLWTSAWLASWLVAFPVVLVVAPLARKAVARLTKA
jgi:ABC-type molybdate transport system permease subunit